MTVSEALYNLIAGYVSNPILYNNKMRKVNPYVGISSVF